jgi:hypothetical protein
MGAIGVHLRQGQVVGNCWFQCFVCADSSRGAGVEVANYFLVIVSCVIRDRFS